MTPGKTSHRPPTHLEDGAIRSASHERRSAIMIRLHAHSLVRRLRPSPERLAAAAAVHDPGPMLALRASSR
jgi:hypothetical protein